MKCSQLLLLMLITAFGTFAQTAGKAKIFTTDIDNFWLSYDSVLKVSDTALQRNIIETMYYGKATAGLKEFMKRRDHTSGAMLKYIRRKPKFWASIRPHTLGLNACKDQLDLIMAKFQHRYPAFMAPDIYFTIGILNSGGTTTKKEILIGTEIAAADSTVDASELGGWLQGVFKTNQNIVYLVTHELVHTQQKDPDTTTKMNLLGYCIREGACDFIAEMLLEKPLTSSYIAYGKANEKTLWNKFRNEMYAYKIEDWLYNGNGAPGGHADLGYFMGYAICKAYYSKAKNKKKAFRDIVSINYASNADIQAFLLKSGYEDSILSSK